MIKKFFKGIINFIKQWGLYGIIAYITLYVPLGLGYIFNDSDLKTTGWIIAAIVAAPNGIGFLLTIIFAALYKWLWKVPIIGFISCGKETILKIQIQNQLMLYYDSEEIQMFLTHGKEIKRFSDDKKKKFYDNFKKERIDLIDQQWSKENEKL